MNIFSIYRNSIRYHHFFMDTVSTCGTVYATEFSVRYTAVCHPQLQRWCNRRTDRRVNAGSVQGAVRAFTFRFHAIDTANQITISDGPKTIGSSEQCPNSNFVGTGFWMEATEYGSEQCKLRNGRFVRAFRDLIFEAKRTIQRVHRWIRRLSSLKPINWPFLWHLEIILTTNISFSLISKCSCITIIGVEFRELYFF